MGRVGIVMMVMGGRRLGVQEFKFLGLVTSGLVVCRVERLNFPN